jgi:hypothetical protein
MGIAIDYAGNAYVADTGNHHRKITPAGMVSTAVSQETLAPLTGGGDLQYPRGVTVDLAGNAMRLIR